MALEPEDRTEDLLANGPPKPIFTGVQSASQMPHKLPGMCRLVTEHFFYVEPEELTRLGHENGTKYVDAVDYLRAVLRWLEAEDLQPDFFEADKVAQRVAYSAAK
jgi:hypothetical protein